MTRITKENIGRAFVNFCNEFNLNPAEFTLDYVSCYGGYRIENNRGAGTPFGHQRRSTKDFYNYLLDCMECHRAVKRLRGE